MIQSATAAYRADIAPSSSPFGAHDGGWIAVASLLEQAVLVPGPERETTVSRAIELARQLLAESALPTGAVPEWGVDEPAASDPIVVLADRAYQAGAFHLGRAMLDALLDADPSLTPRQRGRVIGRRARIDSRLGRREEAADQFRELASQGRRLNVPELQVRGWIGLGTLAQMRGNYPEQVRWSRRAARLADRAGLRSLGRQAHSGLMIAAGAQHRFEHALAHARIAWQAALGDPMHEGEILQNIGQLLLEAGHPAFAADVFTSVLARPLPVRIILPALGGLAMASAAIGQPGQVRWAAAELERLRLTSSPPTYQLASAALECATALSIVRQPADAERLLQVAERTAQANGYFEVIVKAEALRASTSAAAPKSVRPLGRAATRLAREIRTGEPERLPDHVVLAATP